MSMMKLRPYKASDSKYIIAWIADERSHFKWCLHHMAYPLTAEVMEAYENAFVDGRDGWLMTAVDENDVPVGHLSIQRKDGEEKTVRFNYIVVDDKRRKEGIGTEMLKEAVEYTFDTLGMERITLCVFENNQIAHNCYRSAGFSDIRHHERCIPYKDEIWSYYDMEQKKELLGR